MARGRFKKLKGEKFTPLQLMIIQKRLVDNGGKIATQDELAQELGVHVNTIWRQEKIIRESDWFKEAHDKLLNLLPLAIESGRALLMNADGYFTSNLFKGLGLFKETQVLESKLSPEEFRKKVLEDKERLLGSRIGNRIKDFINPEST